LEKIRRLAEYFQSLDPENLGRVANWFTGSPFPASENKALQLGWALLRDAVCAVGGVTAAEFHQVYLKHSDPGETAFEILRDHRARLPALTLAAVDLLFQRIYAARGPASKRPLLITALEHCSALEAKFLVKIFTSELRIGLKEGLVEEAIARAFQAPAEEVRQANLLLGNIGETARLAAEHRLGSANVTPFRPIKFMLASPEETAADIWKRVRSGSGTTDSAHPVWLEDKYDGIRCQLHKVGQRVALYSRDLKEISRSFTDVADAARAVPADLILDGEIVAMRGERILPFAELQKRLGRREADLFLREEIPIRFVAFDLLWRNGESFLQRPLKERREALETLAPLPARFKLSRITAANSVTEIEEAFLAARGRDNEGLMVKEPSSVYTPGRRGLAWLKLKKALATLDCVVVGAEYGHGKRNNVLSDYTFAVRDETTGELKTIGKAYSGLTDAEIAQLTEHFLKTVIRKHGRYHVVEPDTVLEIAFDRVQQSARHDSGLALRFPRIVRIRTDKSPAEIDTLATARRLVK
jgi:DNA ligase-1